MGSSNIFHLSCVSNPSVYWQFWFGRFCQYALIPSQNSYQWNTSSCFWQGQNILSVKITIHVLQSINTTTLNKVHSQPYYYMYIWISAIGMPYLFGNEEPLLSQLEQSIPNQLHWNLWHRDGLYPTYSPVTMPWEEVSGEALLTIRIRQIEKRPRT